MDLKKFVARVFEVKLAHAWLLAFGAVAYLSWAAPLALQSLVLVAAKVWIGALMGHFLGKAMYSEESRPDAALYRKTAVVCAAVLAMSLGV